MEKQPCGRGNEKGMKKLSLKMKSILVILSIAILFSATAIIINYSIYSNTFDKYYRNDAMSIARAAASQMDGDLIGKYVREIEALDVKDAEYNKKREEIKDADYYRLLRILYELKDSHHALYLYVQTVSAEKAVYIMDADQEPSACELGESYPIAEVNYQYINSLDQGIPAFVTNSKYGWLCTAGAPIFDSQHQVSALVFVDISMNQVMADRHRFLILLCFAFMVTGAVATTLIIFIVNKTIVMPINLLSAAAGQFISDKNLSMTQEDESAISRLEIHTGDEIENLSYAIKTMEKDLNHYIKNFTTVTAEKERVDAELNIAKQLQAFLLPCIFPAFPERKEFDLYATMQPAKDSGGDFYDFFLVDNERLAIVMADASGKGVPAALFMVIAKTLIKNLIQAGGSPAEVLTVSHSQLCENNKAGILIKAWIGILQISTGRLIFANAGHKRPLIKKEGRSYIDLEGPVGGILADTKTVGYSESEHLLEPGDLLFLYTDGAVCAENGKHIHYGEERLLLTLNRNATAAPGELLIEVREDIENYIKETPQSKDITMLAVQITPLKSNYNMKHNGH